MIIVGNIVRFTYRIVFIVDAVLFTDFLVVMRNFEEWVKAEEIKERPAVQEIKKSLADLGTTAEHIQPLSEFAHALEKPVMDENRKTYVEVPALKVMRPLLKKVVQKMLGAFEWVRGTQEQVRHVWSRQGLP